MPSSVPPAGAHPPQLQQHEAASHHPQKHEPFQLKRGYSEEPGGFCGHLLCFCCFFFPKLFFFIPPNPLAPAPGQLSARALLIHRVSRPTSARRHPELSPIHPAKHFLGTPQQIPGNSPIRREVF